MIGPRRRARTVAWIVAFAALLLWFNLAPIPGWLLAATVIAALPLGLAARYPHLLPDRLRSRKHTKAAGDER